MKININIPKMTLRKKIAVIGFALYLTFILLSIVPYVAEEDAVRGNLSEGIYESNLLFMESGDYGHYKDVVLENEDVDGKISLIYVFETNTLNIIEIENIKELTIDCEMMYENKCEEVFEESSDTLGDEYYKAYFEQTNNGIFTVNIYSDTPMNKLQFTNAPLPKSVLVNNRQWWKTETGYYSATGNDVTITNIPKEENTIIVINFKDDFQPPVAFFTASKYITKINENIVFDGSGSTDDGKIDHYNWNFGDQSEISGMKVTHSYKNVGEYLVTLTVRDDEYIESSYSRNITIVENETVDSDNDDVPDVIDPNPKSNIDTDGDGLSDDREEVIEHTNKSNVDTDGDGWNDDVEIEQRTDPTDPTSHPPEKSKKTDDEDGNFLLIIIALIVVVVIIIVAIIMRKPKGESEDVVEEDELDEYPEDEDYELPPEMEGSAEEAEEDAGLAEAEIPEDELAAMEEAETDVIEEEGALSEVEAVEAEETAVISEKTPPIKTLIPKGEATKMRVIKGPPKKLPPLVDEEPDEEGYECPDCGETIPGDIPSCPVCGAQFGEEGDDEIGFECPDCGAPVDENALKCPECGCEME